MKTKQSDMTETEKARLLLLMVALPLFMLLDGYVLKQCWGWIVVPTFHLPPLRIASAIGVTAIAGFLTYQNSLTDLRDYDVIMYKVKAGTSLTLWVWFVCWLAHLFM